jgi:hypothetical protein
MSKWIKEDKQDGTWFTLSVGKECSIKVFKPLWGYKLQGSFQYKGRSYYMQTLPFASPATGVDEPLLERARVIIFSRLVPKITEQMEDFRNKMEWARQEYLKELHNFTVCSKALEQAKKIK